MMMFVMIPHAPMDDGDNVTTAEHEDVFCFAASAACV